MVDLTHPDVIDAEIGDLDPSWPGTRVAVSCDLQVGMWWSNTAMAERVVGRVVEEDHAAPQLVLFDLVAP